jgi:ribosome-binding protein aMBF1 (putative translation factor)
MFHQDWTTIQLKNPDKQKFQKEIVQKKGDTSVQDQLKKIENDNENFSIKLIPKTLSNEIITIRNRLKLTQKDVSNKLNIQLNIYTELENGKALYNNQTKQNIQKLEKIFGIKFENKNIPKQNVEKK